MKHRCRAFRCATAVVALLLCAHPAFPWTDADYGTHDYRSFERLPEANRRVDMKKIDYPLLNAALFYETNRRRALQGRKPFRHSPALERAAAGHSRDMARHGFLAHESPVPGKRTLKDRVTGEGLDLQNGAIGENVGDIFGIEYESGKSVYPPDEDKNYFSYRPGGKPIQNHTYLGLAKAALQGWMNSPGHRKNILNGRFTRLGTGSAHYKDASFHNIDRFKVTQNFFRTLD